MAATAECRGLTLYSEDGQLVSKRGTRWSGKPRSEADAAWAGFAGVEWDILLGIHLVGGGYRRRC